MIERILPPRACAVDATDDSALDVGHAALFAEEEDGLGRAVDKRRREFSTARHCARRALARLGLPATAIPRGPKGEPCWPDGVVGSITHCAGYRGAVVARSADLLSVGIDAEPHGPLPDGVLGMVSLPEERVMLAELAAADPTVHWDRLLFCAKETVYKAWFPLAHAWLGFEDARITIDADMDADIDADMDTGAGAGADTDAAAGTFTARLLVDGPTVAGRPLTGFAGRWMVTDGLVLTAATLPAALPPSPAEGGVAPDVG